MFRLGSLMLLVALLAVGFSLIRVLPLLAILLLYVLAFATIRTQRDMETREAQGQPMTRPERVAAYLDAITLGLAAGLASTATFCAICALGYLGLTRVVPLLDPRPESGFLPLVGAIGLAGAVIAQPLPLFAARWVGKKVASWFRRNIQ
jgi:hypothetical protein